MNTVEVLEFLQKDSLHNTSSNYYHNQKEITVYELALELEEKYRVVSKFVERYKDDIMFYIAKEKVYAYMHDKKDSDFIIANYIKGLWLDFMEKGEHGVISKRAIDTGTVGLIDTGEYYQSMEIAYNGVNSNEGLSYF